MAYSNASADKLYTLLPAYLRARDAEEGEPLRALLRIVEAQGDAVEASIAQLGANAFIETCEPWVVPYIGQLVGTTPLFDASRVRDGNTAGELFPELEGPDLRPAIALRNRADVAKTIYYRRRKGIPPMLEELARDVTGWSAHIVEFFELIGWTQWLRNHIRPHALRTPDIRSVERMDRLDGAFDEILHTVDVRPPTRFEGWHGIRNVGFFLWRLGAYGIENADARRLGLPGDFRYHASPLGQQAPLFSRARREGDETGLATELHVPQPIRPARFFEDLRAYAALPVPRPGFTDFYGFFDLTPPFAAAPAPSLALLVDGMPVAPEQIVCRNLEVWSQPGTDRVAVDVARGRIALGPELVPAERVAVYYHHGFPAELGGGPYDRAAWRTRRDLAERIMTVQTNGPAGTFATINDALNDWIGAGRPSAIVRIRDNHTHDEAIAIELADDAFLAIEAENGFRPHLRLQGPLTISGDHPTASLTLGGLLVEGTVEITGSIGRLRLLHTTLVPGGSIAEADPPAPPGAPPASITAVETLPGGAPANTELRVEAAFSITGGLRLPERAEALTLLDCIVDGGGEAAILGVGAPDALGPRLHAERCTIRGAARLREIGLATEVVFDGPLNVERRQTGCVRFSWTAPGARTPRRYRCQPDLAIRRAIEAAEAEAGAPLTGAERLVIATRIRNRVRPEYASESYGQPAYVQLALSGPSEIAHGAEDGSEIGAYCHLKQPQREANLRLRLEEYLPFGLDAGLIYVT